MSALTTTVALCATGAGASCSFIISGTASSTVLALFGVRRLRLRFQSGGVAAALQNRIAIFGPFLLFAWLFLDFHSVSRFSIARRGGARGRRLGAHAELAGRAQLHAGARPPCGDRASSLLRSLSRLRAPAYGLNSIVWGYQVFTLLPAFIGGVNFAERNARCAASSMPRRP